MSPATSTYVADALAHAKVLRDAARAARRRSESIRHYLNRTGDAGGRREPTKVADLHAHREDRPRAHDSTPG
jgi:hypothetical protein